MADTMQEVPESVQEALAYDETLAEHVLSSDVAWRGSFFDVERTEVAMPDGAHAPREFVRHPGGAAVVIVRDGRVCLVRQWRAPQGRITLEIPAGKLDPGETPEDCAARELREETGLVAGELVHLASTSGAPGFTDELTRVYLARDVHQGEAALDDDEFVDVVWLPVDDLLAAIRAGAVNDAKTVAGILSWSAEAERLG